MKFFFLYAARTCAQILISSLCSLAEIRLYYIHILIVICISFGRLLMQWPNSVDGISQTMPTQQYQNACNTFSSHIRLPALHRTSDPIENEWTCDITKRKTQNITHQPIPFN